MSKPFDAYEEEELITINATLVYESTDAFCIKLEEDTFGEEQPRHWLPKSLTRYDAEESTFTLPEWLAVNKGLE